MPHYKNTNNELFWLEEGEDAGKWLSSDCVEITEEETASIRASQETQLTYAEKRAAEYPSFADYLDGVVKGDQEQIQSYIDACLAVKAKYPKPE